MIKLVVSVFAIVMFLVGAILAPTPIPVGLVMMAVASFILIANNKWAADLVRWARRRWQTVDRWMRALEYKVSGQIARTLMQTRPEAAEHSDADADGEAPEAPEPAPGPDAEGR